MVVGVFWLDTPGSPPSQRLIGGQVRGNTDAKKKPHQLLKRLKRLLKRGFGFKMSRSRSTGRLEVSSFEHTWNGLRAVKDTFVPALLCVFMPLSFAVFEYYCCKALWHPVCYLNKRFLLTEKAGWTRHTGSCRQHLRNTTWSDQYAKDRSVVHRSSSAVLVI